MKVIIDHIRCPLHRYPFSVRPIRQWVEEHCEGSVLNLFVGITRLNVDELRNDADKEADADYYMDALAFLENWEGKPFDTILLAPPYAYRKSMKDAIIKHLKPAGKVITFGYHTVVMGQSRGFEVEKIGVFSHGGAIHDTIASVERYQF